MHVGNKVTDYSIIRRCIILAIESMVKQAFTKIITVAIPVRDRCSRHTTESLACPMLQSGMQILF